MCKTKSAAMASTPKSRHQSSSRSTATAGATTTSSSAAAAISSRRTAATSSSSSSSLYSSATSSSLAALRDSLPELPALYPFAEVAAATNNFLSKRLSARSASWRCSLRGKDAAVFQRALRGGSDLAALSARLAALGKSHHTSLARLLGASLGGDHVYIAYEFVPGASLRDCLRNPRNPNFTPLSSWISRMQIAADLAQGIEYIHLHSAATVHNRIKSSAVIVTEPGFRAKICHFGAADLAGDVPADAVLPSSSDRILPRSGSGGRRIEGTRGYMAPEVIAGGRVSPQSDIYALGVVLLELVSGEEPLKYRYDRRRGELERQSLIDTALAAAASGEGVRRWVDLRLRDSYPVDAAERLVGVALRCVDAEAAARPEIAWVAGKVSKLYLDSKAWDETVRVPTDFSVTIAPR
ncbi:lysM domain receptor-like kinase 3 [Ananas comosus]|uniref:LysM domain receptor-like kinase 3 n=1 Tax=Ananas comosus TaxID=4615 RepID=A0A6P5GZY2_ANACO|nr:lysM domain receptor-like kinase 3 [Ananas comosus]XP_020113375.1 lysM domain receptor-like kinase 3 [Ananas comosus]